MYVFETLKKGDRGHEVWLLQATLPAWAWQGIVPLPDGVFGAGTQSAVATFQRAHDLADDGVAGRSTCMALGIWADVLHGIDVSHHQGNIDWKRVVTEIVYVKLTEGKTYQDPRRLENHDGSTGRGFRTGGYHRALGNHSAYDEAMNFVDCARDLTWQMPPSIDVEDNFTKVGTDAEEYICAWCDYVEDALDLEPESTLIYLSARVARKFDLSASTRLARYRNWQPRYGPQPKAVLPFGDWSAWQYKSDGRIDGINANVDVNRFVAAHF